MDLVDLSQEHVLVYVCPFGTNKWVFKGKETTNRHGRLTVALDDLKLPVGIHLVRCIVQGDHSFLNLFVNIVPPETQIVVFSIDGSLTGSVSVSALLFIKLNLF